MDDVEKLKREHKDLKDAFRTLLRRKISLEDDIKQLELRVFWKNQQIGRLDTEIKECNEKIYSMKKRIDKMRSKLICSLLRK